MKRLGHCLIFGPILAMFFAQPAGAKTVRCHAQTMAGRDRDIACSIPGQRAVPALGLGVEALTPTPEIVRLVARAVRGSEVDPRLVLAVIAAESGFDRQAISPKNAVGLMQLMPETIARFGVRNPFDAEENIRAGTSYLRLLLRKYGNLALALAAYDAGEGPVGSYGAVPPYAETTQYVARVLRLYERYGRIPLERGAPLKTAAKAAPIKPAPVKYAAAGVKSIGGCDLGCRGNRLAARLDVIGGRLPVSRSYPDAAWLVSAWPLRAN